MALTIYSSTPRLAGIDHRHLQQIALTVADASQVAEARRNVAERTAALGFTTRRAGEAAIVVTEMAGNLVKHGGGGEVLLRTIGNDAAHAGIELMALDRGRGMDVARCLVDGYSTAGSPGTGLGAIQRLSAESDFYSVAGGGTAVMATIWKNNPPASVPAWIVGGINIALRGEEVCGDAWAVRCDGRCIDAMMVDGLGHGHGAAEASGIAVATFTGGPPRSPTECLELADGALQGTRGAAMGVAAIDAHRGEVGFAGVGNTVAVVIAAESAQHLVSLGGIVGQRRIPLRQFTATWLGDSIFIAHSDGINTRWSLGALPGLASRHPSLIAAVLYRDFARGKDDASVLVIKART